MTVTLGRPLEKLGIALRTLLPEDVPIQLPNLLLSMVELQYAMGFIGQNNQAELTNQIAGTILSTLTVPEDGFYRIWGNISVKTALAATVRASISVNDEGGNTQLWLANRYLSVAVGSVVELAPPGIFVWLKRNWVAFTIQQTATGVGETLRGDINLIRMYQ